MKLTALTISALLASTSFLSASTVDDVVAKLEGDGYQIIEVESRGGKIEVKARLDGKVNELVFDATSGDLLLDDNGGDDQAGSDDHGDNDQGRDDSGDDDHGDDGGDDDHGDDDHSDDDGGDDDHGDDDSSDDH